MWGSGPSFAEKVAADAPEAEPVAAPAWDKPELPKIVVVDTNAVVKGIRIERFGDKAVTIPEVIDEIKDKQAKHFLATLPFGIETREPSDESLRAVKKFAALTGDLHSLSIPDMKLIALAHTLEAEVHGLKHIRKVPATTKQQKKKKEDSKLVLPGWGNVPNPEDWAEFDEDDDDDDDAKASPEGDTEEMARKVQELGLDLDENAVGASGAATLTDGTASSTEAAPSSAAAELPQSSAAEHDPLNESVDTELSTHALDDDDDGWEKNTSRRVKNKKAKRAMRAQQEEEEEERQAAQAERQLAALAAAGAEAAADAEQGGEGGEVSGQGHQHRVEVGAEAGEEEEDDDIEELAEESTIASLTADFPMQNVILQMNMRLLTPDGMRVKSLERWAFRCDACFFITHAAGKQFCPRCGKGGTMRKVSMTVDAEGLVQYGIRKRFNIRGTRFSLPAPKGGRLGSAANPILAADQVGKLAPVSRRAEEWGAGQVQFFGGVGVVSDSNPNAKGGGPALGSGRRNPNERVHKRNNRRRK